MLNAFAAIGSHTAIQLFSSVASSGRNGGFTIVRYSGTSSTTAGMNRVIRISPLRIGAYFGRSTESA